MVIESILASNCTIFGKISATHKVCLKCQNIFFVIFLITAKNVAVLIFSF